MNNTRKHLIGVTLTVSCLAVVLAGNWARNSVDGVQAMSVVSSTSPVAEKAAVAGLTASTAESPEPSAIPADVYFEQLSEKLKSDYVDPIDDDSKLVTGAIKGMIASLNDPNCQFMEKDQYKAFMNARSGQYEGIGVELVFELSKEDRVATSKISTTVQADELTDVIRIPRIVVASVVPDSPAGRAGVKPGDWVQAVDGQWVINSDILKELRSVQVNVQKGKAKTTDLLNMKKKLRDLGKNSLLPLRALNRLTIGTTGSVKVTWNRGNRQVETIMSKAQSSEPLFSVGSDGVINLHIVNGQADDLKKAISGKNEVTIDLRGNVMGDFNAMKECMAVLAPTGTYGYVTREQGVKATPLMIKEGNPKPPKINLLVDSRTQNVAEIMALALSSKGIAKLAGEEMAGDRSVTEIVELPDKSAYTLVTGKYVVNKPIAKTTKPVVKSTGKVTK